MVEVEIGGSQKENGSTPPLTEWWNVFRVIQANEVWRAHGAWVSEHQPQFGPGVKERFEGAGGVTDAEAAEASKTRDAIAASMESTMVDEATGKDRFLFLPTSVSYTHLTLPTKRIV